MSAYDVIVVLGAGVWEGGTPSPAMRQRVRHAFTLHSQGRAPWLLMTGGLGKHPPAEAALMKTLAVQLGVPEERVLAEDRSMTTLESVVACTRIMRNRGWTRALVVSHRYHLPRSVASFAAFGVRAWGSSCNIHPGWRLSRLHAREAAACAVYALKLPLARWRHRHDV